MINKVILIGRISNDLKIEEYGENKVMKFNLAVGRAYKKEGVQDTDFVRCTFWNKLSELVNTYCKKGDLIAVEGRLQVSEYSNPEGEKRTSTEVVVENIQFLEKKQDE